MRRSRPIAALLAGLCVAALTSSATAAVKVVVTIKPVHALALQIMRGVGEPTLLVKGASSPHGYALTPGDAIALSHAALLFRVSPTIEPFTQKLISALPDSVEVVTLIDAPGLHLLTARREVTFNAEDLHAGGALGDSDGHVWLDPGNAQRIVEQIARVLSRHDPANAATYGANASTLKSRLQDLAVELDGLLKPVSDRPFIVLHDAMQYFERRFRLNAVGAISVSPEIPPSGSRLLQLRQRITAGSIVCVFAEPWHGGSLVSTMIEGTGVRVGTLDPEGVALDPGPDVYFTLMRGLAGELTHCLSLPS
jgi:zinc transport system substrate-binding protein